MNTPKPPSQLGCSRIEDCIELCDSDPVYLEENGVRANFARPRAKLVRKIEYDDCYDKEPNTLKADYIVGLIDVVDVIVELKGSDRKHARDQVETTLGKWRQSGLRYPRIVCLVVYGRLEGKNRKAGRIPKINSSNEALERDFLRRNNALLWVRESCAHHYQFTELLGKADGK
jgi:hypothetical protein